MKRKITFLAIGLLVAFVSSYSQIADVSDMKWHSETPLDVVLAFHGAAYYDNAIYVIGGDDSTFNPINTISKYDVNSKEWSQVCEIPDSVSDFSAVQIGGKIYIYGGYNYLFTQNRSDMLIYNIASNTFQTKTMPQGTNYEFGICVYNEKYIYIVGGRNYSYVPMDEVHIYDITNDQWFAGTSLPDSLGDVSCTLIGNKIYAAPGVKSSNDVSADKGYIGTINPANPAEISWTANSAFPHLRGMTVGSWSGTTGQYAFFTGGFNSALELYSSADIYDVQNDTWLKAPDKPTVICFSTNFVKVIRNDSVFMVATGGVLEPSISSSLYTNANEWLYVGMDDTPLPVELTSYEAKAFGNSVELTWATATEVNNYGFEVARKSAEGEYKVIASVEGHGNSSSPNSYSYVDKEAKSAGEYTYKLTQIDFDGKKKVEGEKTVTVSAPEVNELAQNYPNPCNPSTVIKYAIAKAGSVELKVYNTLGEEVATLANEYKEAGSYTATFNAAGLNLPSGIYIYRIKAQGFTETKKLMLIK